MTETNPKEEDQVDVDFTAIQSGPAVFSNKVYSTVLHAGMRLTFMEVSPETGKESFRSSVFLQYQDIIALQALLGRQMEKTSAIDANTPPTDEKAGG